LNILFIDSDEKLFGLFQHLDTIKDINITFCVDDKCTTSLYEKGKFDIILLNFSSNIGNEFLDVILLNDLKQRIITISPELSCSENLGCDYCVENLNKKRLLTPVDIGDLITLIKNFDTTSCKFKDKFTSKDGILDILQYIVTQYDSRYDLEKKIIYTKLINAINIISLLNQNNIKHEIDLENANKCTIEILE